MSKKRDEIHSSPIGLIKRSANSKDRILKQIDNAKRGKLASLSQTTLQDLPTEMLECIVVQAVALEVVDMKLAKSVWKEKAELVINRLRTVCLHWNCILNTNSFRNKLHRALDNIAQDTIRLEILHQSVIQNCFVLKVVALKDEVFVACLELDFDGVSFASDFVVRIRVYNRNNVAEMKDVISLPDVGSGDMAACNLSNCLYILNVKRELHYSSILRIAREEGQEFNVHPWINDLTASTTSIFSSEQGSLLIMSTPDGLNSHVLSVYGPNGVLQQELMLSPDVYGFKYIKSVLQKSSGSFILSSVNEQLQTLLTEINSNGVIQRQYTASHGEKSGVSFADTSGRIVIKYKDSGIKLLDSELNLLEFSGPQSNEEFDIIFLHYNGERNEVLGYRRLKHEGAQSCALVIFRFTKE